MNESVVQDDQVIRPAEAGDGDAGWSAQPAEAPTCACVAPQDSLPPAEPGSTSLAITAPGASAPGSPAPPAAWWESRQRALEERLAALESGLLRLAADDRERTEQRRNREALYERLDASRASFQLQLLRPLIQGLAMFGDRLYDLERCPPPPADSAALFPSLAAQLRETLALHGIEAVRPQVGETFDARYHYIVEARPTSDPAMQSRIAQVVLEGVVFLAPHDRTGEIRPTVVRPARVVTWRYAAQVSSGAASVSVGMPAATSLPPAGSLEPEMVPEPELTGPQAPDATQSYEPAAGQVPSSP